MGQQNPKGDLTKVFSDNTAEMSGGESEIYCPKVA